MGCSHPKEIIESFNDDLKHFENRQVHPEFENRENITELKKGGLVVQTKIGNIQFGMPPETVKDSQNAGFTVPTVYIIPNNRFDKEHVLSAAEFEFPAYFNFFVQRKNIILVADDEAERAIRTVFQETLLGPKDFSNFKEEFTMDYPYIPDMQSELKHFAVNPFTQEELTLESVITIVNYDAQTGIAHIQDNVCVEKKDGWITIHEDDTEVARFRDKVMINAKHYEAYKSFYDEKNNILMNSPDQLPEEFEEKKDTNKLPNINGKDIETDKETPNNQGVTQDPSKIKEQGQIPIGFNPPDFGITFQGTGHGFDTKDSTSGHIIWINGKGIMIDPPPFSALALKYYGVSPNLIDKIIITHCHADHDAGVLQKLLSGYKIELITTPTIMGSFIKKYAAICKMEIKEQQTLFEFRPITIGHPLEISAAKFRFFYSLHVIPCIGYECEYQGKNVYFSGDTYFDPEKLKALMDKGVLTPSRYEHLVNKEWSKFDVILHEAGVPPIHTATKVLQQFPEEIKKKMYLYHVATKDMPKEGDLQKAAAGFENSIVIIEKSDGDIFDRNLEQISNIAMFREMPLRRQSDQLKCLKNVHYQKGETVCKKGTIGWDFYIIKTGIIKVYNKDDQIQKSKFEKYYYSGDFFGEAAITGDGLRLANVVAHTNCHLLTLTAYDFKWFFGPQANNIIDHNTIIMDKMTNLNDLRKGLYAEFINSNKFVSKLTEQQKNDINASIKEYSVTSNETLWRKEDIDCRYCFFIYSGEFALFGQDKAPGFSLRRGQLVGDFPNLIQNKICVSTVKCVKNGLIQKLDKKHFCDFVKKNPGQFVVLKDKLVID